jgi:hypothetical protein
MNIHAWYKGLLTILPLLGLAACLTSDPPHLTSEDLSTPNGFAGAYYATRFPDDTSGPNTIDAIVTAEPDRTYRLTFLEGEHKDDPVVVQLITLNSGSLLAVFTDPKPENGAMYGELTVASNGAWVFRMVEFAAEKRTRTLQDALMRHGATGVTFDSGDLQHDEIKGAPSAANLRALFSDPDFVNALDKSTGFRLSPKS